MALSEKTFEIFSIIPEDTQKGYDRLIGLGNQIWQSLFEESSSEPETRIQGNFQSLHQFGINFGILDRLVYPEAPKDFIHQISVNHFINGIEDLEFQQTLSLSCCRELKEAIIYALEF